MMSSWFQCAIYPLDTRIGGRRFLWKIVVRSKCGGNMRIGMRDRSKNRKPLQKGRNLSIEAIQAVQALKRVASKNDDAVAVEQVFNSKIRRLLKSDMIAVLRELLRQNQCLLALKSGEASSAANWPQVPLGPWKGAPEKVRDQRGLWGRPKPGRSIRLWNAVSSIVAGSARLWCASSSACSGCWPVGSPFNPS
ncbi:uncharacterized protein LOC107863943 isoform X2 [Capsicum annuum]|uniref:uncharacterized protein LOC107863943 isoform X2 n=1 Tax=Capsicum annuum TaxID=4072 RepID=UPI001FB0F318|nr:uncharacterized protein LOC107863943 isoform X2 [Capsicum annuum]